ncbi:MAG: hypothetical protein HETSPECPRED_001163 [Heterodermia speciosa]|uniref:Effector protein n=1 Tax=Heterodermia speciosa TaxID=116794 RepID=A0A8H3J0Z5_9LECA|nr:MAG: hypothetical protein HETSPECPRED_001163 [Heterodermia speciosa]
MRTNTSQTIHLLISLLLLLPLPTTARSIHILTNSTSTTKSTASAPIFCGSRGMSKCATSLTCIADPANLATSLIGDRPGLCARTNGRSCSGVTDTTSCPRGQTCVDLPNDGCNPQMTEEGLLIAEPGMWRTDCPGVCVFLDGRSAAG